MPTDTVLLAADRETLFVLNESGRIIHENDPDRSQGPLFWLAGCEAGNAFAIDATVDDGTAAILAGLVEAEPPFVDPQTAPRALHQMKSALHDNAGALDVSCEHVFALPHRLRYGEQQLIACDTAEGAQLLDRLRADGMPESLAQLGIRVVEDFWYPWCAVIVDGEIASLAFAARLADGGAELGLVTCKQFRGRGLAAAATAGWSALPALAVRHLFYSTSATNSSSLGVTGRLGLRQIGASMRISRR